MQLLSSRVPNAQPSATRVAASILRKRKTSPRTTIQLQPKPYSVATYATARPASARIMPAVSQGYCCAAPVNDVGFEPPPARNALLKDRPVRSKDSPVSTKEVPPGRKVFQSGTK